MVHRINCDITKQKKKKCGSQETTFPPCLTLAGCTRLVPLGKSLEGGQTLDPSDDHEEQPGGDLLDGASPGGRRRLARQPLPQAGLVQTRKGTRHERERRAGQRAVGAQLRTESRRGRERPSRVHPARSHPVWVSSEGGQRSLHDMPSTRRCH